MTQSDQSSTYLQLIPPNLTSKDAYYFDLALELAEKSLQSKEVPVGCVIVYNDEIIGHGINEVNKSVIKFFLTTF